MTPEQENAIRKKWRAAARKRIRQDRKSDLAIWAAKAAARFAQSIGLPTGNLWEPAMARHLAAQVNSGIDRDIAEMSFALRLGLTPGVE